MPEPTVGTSDAAKVAPEPAAVKGVTPESGANGSDKKDLQARFDALTGEIARKDEKIAKLQTQLTEATDKAKTDDEKRLEQIAAEKFGPQLAEGKSMKDWLAARRDALLAKIPDDYKQMVIQGDNIPIHQQIVQAEGVLALLNTKPGAQPFSGGGNPTVEQKRTYSQAEYQKWSNAASTDAEYYQKHREEMISAVREGRVEGMR